MKFTILKQCLDAPLDCLGNLPLLSPSLPTPLSHPSPPLCRRSQSLAHGPASLPPSRPASPASHRGEGGGDPGGGEACARIRTGTSSSGTSRRGFRGGQAVGEDEDPTEARVGKILEEVKRVRVSAAPAAAGEYKQ